MTRSRRSAWSYLTGLGLTVLTLLTGLIATPLTLRWLGAERLGAFRAAIDWLGYLALLELGLGGALLPLVARAVSARDDEALKSAMRAGFRVFRRVTLWMFVAGILLVAAITKLVPVAESLRQDLRIGVAIGMLSIAVIPFSPLRTLAEASQRGYLVNVLFGLQSLATTILIVLFARAGFGIRGQFAATVVGGVVFTVALAFDGRKRFRNLFSRGEGVDEGVARAEAQLWQLNRPTLIFNVSGRVGLLTDNIVVALFLGPAAVVPFFITQRLTQLAQGQLQSIGTSTWAALVELHVTGQSETFSRRLVELTRLVVVLGLAAMIPIVAYNHRFVHLWVVGPQFFGGTLLTALAGLNGVLLSVFSLWGWVFSGTGRVAVLSKLYIVAAVVNLTASLILTWLFGLVGPLLGTSVSFLGVFLWWEPLLLKKEFGISGTALLRAIAGPLVVGAPFGAVVWYAAQRELLSGWIGLGFEMAVAGSAFLLLAWAGILDPSERQLWMARLRTVF